MKLRSVHMKPINQIAETVKNQISQGSAGGYRQILPKNALPEPVINRVFAKLVIKYGHKWASLYPDEEIYAEAKKDWSVELGGISLEQIKYALDIVVDNYPEWPPTVGQFKQLCKLSEIEPDYVPLKLDNPAKPETDAANLAAMMQTLKR